MKYRIDCVLDDGRIQGGHLITGALNGARNGARQVLHNHPDVVEARIVSLDDPNLEGPIVEKFSRDDRPSQLTAPSLDEDFPPTNVLAPQFRIGERIHISLSAEEYDTLEGVLVEAQERGVVLIDTFQGEAFVTWNGLRYISHGRPVTPEPEVVTEGASEPDETGTVRFGMFLSSREREMIRVKAAKAGVSMSQYVLRRALDPR